MANSMETNVNLGRVTGPGAITRVKSREFDSKRHPSFKKGKEKEKRKKKMRQENVIDEISASSKSRNTDEQESKKKKSRSSGNRLDVIV
jgi:hypothetical protein